MQAFIASAIYKVAILHLATYGIECLAWEELPTDEKEIYEHQAQHLINNIRKQIDMMIQEPDHEPTRN